MKALIFFLLLAVSGLAQSQADYDAHIKKFEGFRSQPYRDGDHWAVGIGHQIPKGQRWQYANLSYDHLMQIYQVDFSYAYAAALKGVPNWEDQSKEVRVLLVALAFNVGDQGFQDFVHFRAAIVRRHYLSASEELRHSKWARQVGTARRDAYIQILIRAALQIPL